MQLLRMTATIAGIAVATIAGITTRLGSID
jgi:hypothetical protein